MDIRKEDDRKFLDDIIRNPVRIKDADLNDLAYFSLDLWAAGRAHYPSLWIYFREPIIFKIASNNLISPQEKAVYLLTGSGKTPYLYARIQKEGYEVQTGHISESTESITRLALDKDRILVVYNKDKERFEKLCGEDEPVEKKAIWYKRLFEK